nr:immunoglobulin heavy chain junction region [Mus musculus]
CAPRDYGSSYVDAMDYW